MAPATHGRSAGRPGASRSHRAVDRRVRRATRRCGERLSQIDVTTPRDAVVLLDDDPALLHLGDTRFVERVQGVSRAGADAARTARRRSTTWICASTSGSTCDHGPARRRSRSWSDERDGDLMGMARKERYLVGLDVGTVEGRRHRRRAHGRWQPRHHRHRARRVEGHPPRRRQQRRLGRRRDQAGARRSRADGRRSRSTASTSRCRARTSRRSTAVAWWRSPAAIGRSRATT